MSSILRYIAKNTWKPAKDIWSCIIWKFEVKSINIKYELFSNLDLFFRKHLGHDVFCLVQSYMLPSLLLNSITKANLWIQFTMFEKLQSTNLIWIIVPNFSLLKPLQESQISLSKHLIYTSIPSSNSRKQEILIFFKVSDSLQYWPHQESVFVMHNHSIPSHKCKKRKQEH